MAKDEKSRGKWNNKCEYFLTSLSYAVGLGNVWRFPYLCYRNGGGSFFIPYLLSLVFLGFTFFFLESALGQYSSESPVKAWNISPLFQGIGIAMFIMGCYVGIYYNMIIAWAIYFLYSSFTFTLPWSHCDNDWNTIDCRVINSSTSELLGIINVTNTTTTPSDEFFHRHVLNKSDSLEDIGSLNLHLVLSLLVAWILVFLCLIGGVTSMGKVAYFTALFPYVVLTILLVRGATLPGAKKGIEFYLTPKWKDLLDITVWADAAMQIFFSLSICMGGVITLASYNQFHNNCLSDSYIIVICNSATSIYGGFAIFSIIGFMAQSLGEEIDTVIQQGVGLGFVAYPAAVVLIPWSPFWAVIFFLMLITLGLGSQITYIETLVVIIMDEWPEQLRPYKIFILLGVCCSGFLGGLLLCTDAGIYILQLMDSYSAQYSSLIIGLLEIFVICWVYGLDRFLDNIRQMLGHYPFPKIYWKFMFLFGAPVYIIIILILTLVYLKPIQYGDYTFPVYSEVIGWTLALSSIIAVPIVAIIKIVKSNLPLMKAIQTLSRPSQDWGKRGDDNNNNNPSKPKNLSKPIKPSKPSKSLKRNKFNKPPKLTKTSKQLKTDKLSKQGNQ